MTELSLKNSKPNSPLIGLLTILGEGKWLWFTFIAVGASVAIGCVLLMPRYYAATAVIMPAQQQPQGAGMAALAQLGNLGAMTGGGMGFKSADDTYVAFLKTRRLQDALIARHQLQTRYQAGSIETTRFALMDLVNVTSDKKSGLISITVEDTDSKFAAELANSHVTELQKMLSEIAVTEAQQRRMFFESQVNTARDALTKAEAKFLGEKTRSGFVVTQALAEISVREGGELRAQIAAREVSLQAMSRFATDVHPDIQRISAELAALRAKLVIIENGKGRADLPGNNDDGEIGKTGGGALAAFREMKLREAALEALIRQFELAKLDESREGPALQKVDAASPSSIPSRPKRVQFVALSVLLFSMLGAFALVVRANFQKTDSDDARAWLHLRNAWHF